MLRRHWGILLAFGIAAVGSVLIWISLQPGQPNLPVYEYEKASEPGYQAGTGTCEPSVLSAIRNGRQAARERERCAEEAEDHRLNSNDLVQQTRAANAAEAQTALMYQQSWIALFQTLGGFLTLVAAGAAAFYARDAAKEAKRNADFTGQMAFDAPVGIAAAVEANNAMREANEIAIAAQRPWLALTLEIVSDAEMIDAGLHFGANILIRNVGSSPALDVRITLDTFNQRAPKVGGPERFIRASYDRASANEPRGFAICPNEEVSHPIGFKLLRKDFAASRGLASDTIVPLVMVSVTYRREGDRWARQTAKGFVLERLSTVDPHVSGGFIVAEDRVPASRVRVMHVGEGGAT